MALLSQARPAGPVSAGLGVLQEQLAELEVELEQLAEGPSEAMAAWIDDAPTEAGGGDASVENELLVVVERLCAPSRPGFEARPVGPAACSNGEEGEVGATPEEASPDGRTNTAAMAKERTR